MKTRKILFSDKSSSNIELKQKFPSRNYNMPSDVSRFLIKYQY